MSPGTVACPRCRAALPEEAWTTDTPVPCPGCRRRIHVEVFPALDRPVSVGRHSDTIVESGVSSCFYHETRKAAIACDGCGRFLCTLCHVELHGRHLCPNCLQMSQADGSIVSLERSRTIYDSAALTLALAPLLFFPLTIFTAPVALVYAIRSFRSPGSVVPRTRFRAWLALILSLAQVGGWVTLLIASGT